MRRGTRIDEELVREALSDLLRTSGIEPRDEWVSVRLVQGPLLARQYVVVIAYPSAKNALWPELDRITGELEGVKSDAGVWVLTEREARVLCERHLAPKPW